MSIKLGCIADDFTGATDLANNLVRRHARRADHRRAGRLAARMPTRWWSRSRRAACPPTRRSRNRWRRWHGCGRRAPSRSTSYCSTFDSTPQGNIGPVTDALMARLGTDFTIATPAFPDNKRTVFKGYLFVGDVLLNESGMQHHPLTPMTDPNLLRVLAAQTAQGRPDRPCRGGARAIRERIAAARRGRGDRHRRCRVQRRPAGAGPALKDMPLVTAGSGVAIGLPANWA